eukprot:2718810-Prymnesium_polylepis.1
MPCVRCVHAVCGGGLCTLCPARCVHAVCGGSGGRAPLASGATLASSAHFIPSPRRARAPRAPWCAAWRRRAWCTPTP